MTSALVMKSLVREIYGNKKKIKKNMDGEMIS